MYPVMTVRPDAYTCCAATHDMHTYIQIYTHPYYTVPALEDAAFAPTCVLASIDAYYEHPCNALEHPVFSLFF